MRRYIIIAIAILAAILVMSLVKLWQDRRARARGRLAPGAGGPGPQGAPRRRGLSSPAR